MALITNPSKLTKQIQPKPMTQDEINEISIKLLGGLKKYGGIGLSAKIGRASCRERV